MFFQKWNKVSQMHWGKRSSEEYASHQAKFDVLKKINIILKSVFSLKVLRKHAMEISDQTPWITQAQKFIFCKAVGYQTGVLLRKLDFIELPQRWKYFFHCQQNGLFLVEITQDIMIIKFERALIFFSFVVLSEPPHSCMHIKGFFNIMLHSCLAEFVVC